MNKIRNYIARKPALKKHGQGVKDVRSVHNVRILVIDDEAAMLNLLESYLSTRYQVDCATDGEAALKKISSD
jgi:PleD family two-component response regulator